MQKMKKLFTVIIFSFLCVGLHAQSYVSIPYSNDFESGLGSEWTTSGPGRVRTFDNISLAYENDNFLLMDDTAGGTNNSEITLHLKLSNTQDDISMSFYMKDFGDVSENDDAIFLWDSATSAFVKVVQLNPDPEIDTGYVRMYLDIDSLMNEFLTTPTSDSIRIMIRHRGEREYNHATSQGFGIDSLVVTTSTYASIPYFTSFESGRFDQYWSAGIVEGTEEITNAYITPTDGTQHLVLANPADNDGDRVAKAYLNIDASTETEISLRFKFQDMSDETDALGGVYFSDDGGKTFKQVANLDQTGANEDIWIDTTLDVDILAASVGLALTDKFVIQFKQIDNYTATDDGFAFDSVAVYRTPDITPGSISGNDTICLSDTNTATVSLSNITLPQYGEGNYTYTWESSVDLINWNVEATSIGTDTILPPPIVTTYYKRCVTTDSGQGPACTTPIMYLVRNNPTAILFSPTSQLCENSSDITLTGLPSTPAGVLTGTAVTDLANGTGIFSPTGLSGNYDLVYTYIDANGCSANDTFKITVDTVPNVNISGVNASYCVGEAQDTIIGALAGGGFSGLITASTNTLYFNPTSSYLGTNDLIYSYTDGNGCVGYDTAQVIVNSTPNVSFSGLNSDYCINAGAVTMSGSPGGGTFTGSGVSGNSFTPSTVTAGNYDITYTYTDGNGCTDSSTRNTEVHALPVINIFNLETQYCDNGNPVTISGSPVVGTFSGTGITDNANGTGTFNPSGLNGSYTITYSYTDSYGCANSKDSSTNVNVSPNVTLTGLNATYVDTDTVKYTLNNSPAGGTFSGPGLYDSLFVPANSGALGQKVISYTYTDANGCSNTAYDTTTLISAGAGAIAGLSTDYCVGDPSVIIYGSPIQGEFYRRLQNVSTGSFLLNSVYGHFTPVDVSLTDGGWSSPFANWDTVQFNPGVLPPGTYRIYYYYQDISGGGNPSVYYNQVFTVHDLPNVSIGGLDTAYCVDDPVSSLQAYVGGNPVTGTFSGAGVPAASSLFDPDYPNVGLGADTVFMFYTNPSTGCIGYDTATTFINGLPSVNINGVDASYCTNDPDDILTGSPLGGYFSGLYASSNDTITIDLNTSIVGSFDMYYTYTDGNGCTGIDTATITTNPLPVVSLTTTLPSSSLCVDPDTLSLIGNPATGTFSGPGIFNVGTGTASFNPSLAGVGDSSFVYTITEASTGCVNSYVTSFRVNSLPTLTILGLDSSYCIQSDEDLIQASPSGGTFYYEWGTNNTTGIYDPKQSSVGLDSILYTYTDGNGCYNDTIVTTIINGLPTVSITGIDANDYCAGDRIDTLIGIPLGGVFSGVGIQSNLGDTIIINPDTALTGLTNYISYQYTDTNGCVNVDTQLFVVNPLPNLNYITPFSANLYCEDADTVEVIGSQPTGTFTGAGMVNTGSGKANFIPTSVIPDSTYLITFSYTNINSCTKEIYKNITVASLPNPTIIGLDSSYCQFGPEDQLDGSPSGGLLTGTSGNITNSTFFDPINSGQNVVRYDYTDGNGCSNFVFDTTYVHTLPVLSIDSLNAEYCADDEVDTIFVNKIGELTSFSGLIYVDTFSLFGVFSPSVVSGNSFDTTYVQFEHIDSNGCYARIRQDVIINALPEPTITDLTFSQCEDWAKDTISGFPVPSTGQSSTFMGSGITNISPGVASFDPTVILSGNYNDTVPVSYAFVDVKGCTDTATQMIIVRPLPVVSFFDSVDNKVCPDVNFFSLNPNPPISSALGTGNFTGSPGVTSGSQYFIPANALYGEDTLIYTFTNIYGCVNYDTNYITVYPPPIVDFTIGSFCNNDSILFNDFSIIDVFTNGGTNNDSIVSWLWDFGDNSPLDTLQNPSHKYSITNTYPLNLQVTTREGCVAELDSNIEVGRPPEALFQWDVICAGYPTNFESILKDANGNDILSSSSNIDPIEFWFWNFGDGNYLDNINSSFSTLNGDTIIVAGDDNGGITTNTYQNPYHLYDSNTATDTTITVQLILQTENGCLDTLEQQLNIRPVVTEYPYLEDFESGNRGWYEGGSTNSVIDSVSWELGIAKGRIINDSITGNNSWVTGLERDHNNNEQSFVDGPCFNFSSLSKPMIIMDIWRNMLVGSDGAVLQYSIDDGVTWELIGKIGDGINWYDENSINGDPGEDFGGNNVANTGWSAKDTGWVEVRHDLDVVAGVSSVRLRIAFGSDGSGSDDGFAFDNVRIEERSRLALIEHFANMSDANSMDELIDSFVIKNKRDLVDIQYHIDVPGQDDFNDQNPADPNSRQFYYSIPEAGMSVLNGNVFNGQTEDLTENHIKLQILKDSPFNLLVEADFSQDDAVVTAQIKAREDFVKEDISLQLAVVEKRVIGNSAANGDNVYYSVLKKLLPTAIGTVFSNDWITNDSIKVTRTWTKENVTNDEQLKVVAFIQGTTSKEVYQVATSDDSTVNNDLHINQKLEDIRVMVYPNPSSGDVTIMFNQKVNSPIIQLYDQYGRLLEEIVEKQFVEDISLRMNYPSGIYFIKTILDTKTVTDRLILNK